jgi:hypothetical protein
MKLFRYILPIVFLFLSFLVVGQTITTYYPKVDRQSREYIHIMKVVVEPNQVYVVFRYNVLGNDKVGMGSQTSLRCGSFISTIQHFGILSDSIQRELPFDKWISLNAPENVQYASKPFIYVDENGEKWNARSYDFFMVFPGKLPEYARKISIYENAESFYGSDGSNPFNWEGIHINNLHPEEEW